ncbi:tetratricopeptide repeat protein [candidate division WOR-3 bacterium]|nr:tetratricopeptide repeat protein [candidate division WOR-3 bacterium]
MFLLFLMFLGQISHAQTTDTSTGEHVLNSARQHYENGAYVKSIAELETILPQLNGAENGEAIIEIHVLLAFNYVAVGDEASAIEHYKKALAIEPKLQIDAYEPSPEVRAVFEEATKERAYESAGCSCLIPGSGQFMRGDDLKGGAIIAVSVTSLASTVISWSIADSKHNLYMSLGPDDIDMMEEVYEDYNHWRKMTILSGTVLLGVYVYSIIDATISKKPSLSKSTSRQTGLLLGYDGERARIGYATKL